MSIVANLKERINKFLRYHQTPNASNQNLTRLNGSVTLGDNIGNIIVNGSAKMGDKKRKLTFGSIIVVNGSIEVSNSSFERLEVNGSAFLENIQVQDSLHIHGNAVLVSCDIHSLKTYGSYTRVKLIDTNVQHGPTT